MSDNSSFLSERAALLSKYSEAYYEGSPLVDDATFDALQAEYVTAGGAETVGHGYQVSGDRKVVHRTHMGSLKKVKGDRDDMLSWFKNVHQFWSENCDTNTPLMFNVSPKFDGLAVAVTVEGGKPVMVATRGDGYVGEDVTDTAVNIPQIGKLNVDGTYFGEVMLPVQNLDAANSYRDEREAPLSQIRNAAAGMLRREAKRKPRETVEAYTDRRNKIYDSAALLVFADHNSGDYVEQYGYTDIVEKLDDILSKFEPLRTNYPVLNSGTVYIDGVVFKVVNQDVRDGLGSSSGSPKWARAYKYDDMVYESVINNVSWGAPGKIGRITPVIEYDTIVIANGNYSRATAHNLSQFKALNPHRGDKVQIIKSGEVIPYVVSVSHTGDGEPFDVPQHCPSCGAVTAVDGEYLICTNDRVSCNPAKALTLIISSLGIKGVQEKVVTKIYDNLLKDYDNVYDALAALKNMPAGEISSVDGLGEKMDEKIRKDLMYAWGNAPLRAWLYGLNVDRVGSTVSTALEVTYGSLDNIIAAIDDPGKYREVQHLKGVNWAAIVANRDRFTMLNQWIKNNGVAAVVEEEAVVVDDDFWGGKKVAVTGTLSGVTRGEAESWLRSRGATISGSFDILIDAGDGSSSKSVKARQKGKTVMLGSEFLGEHYSK